MARVCERIFFVSQIHYCRGIAMHMRRGGSGEAPVYEIELILDRRPETVPPLRSSDKFE